MKFEYLNAMILNRGIRKTVIARSLNISERALSYKIEGTAPFTWEQACKIQSKFFPDIEKDKLFSEKIVSHHQTA